MTDLNIIIAHRIPGRLRLRLQRAPRSVNDFIVNIKRHEGIDFVGFHPVTKSLLIYYQPTVISSIEIVVRTGIALSLDYSSSQVSIMYHGEDHSLYPFDYYAGGALIGATAARISSAGTGLLSLLEYNAGLSTLLAVLRHAWMEVRKNGIYDPEVVSVVYLINSLVRGNLLTASAITWIATFGRHLFADSKEVCRLEASGVEDASGKEYIDVVISPVHDRQVEVQPLRLLVHGLGKVVGLSPHRGQPGITEQIKQMSVKHGNILEGIGRNAGPVYMRLTQ